MSWRAAGTNRCGANIRLQLKQTALFQVSVQYITSFGWVLVLTHCLSEHMTVPGV